MGPITLQRHKMDQSDNVKYCSFQLPQCNDLNLFFVIYDGYKLLAGPQKQSEDVTFGLWWEIFHSIWIFSARIKNWPAPFGKCHEMTFVVNWRLTQKDWLINGETNPQINQSALTLTCSLEVTAQNTISVKPCEGNIRKQIPPITRPSLISDSVLCFLSNRRTAVRINLV